MSPADDVRIEQAIRFIDARRLDRPRLEAVAAHVGLSAFHFQRLFQRGVGVSPKRYLQFQTLQDAKGLLGASRDLLDASLALGLSGPSRLHDLFLTLEAMTPGEFKAGSLEVSWGLHPSPLGPVFVAVTGKGLCGLSFAKGTRPALADLGARWPSARFVERPAATAPYARELARRLRGAPGRALHLRLRGTPFQLKVWEALLRIPAGGVASYADVASLVGQPTAARAVGGAVGDNPISVLIPCHRVIRAGGAFGNYGGGPWRKRALLGLEHLQARASQSGNGP